jgi:hypothetical protein
MSFFTPPNPGPGWGQTGQLASTTIPADAVTGEMQIVVNIDTSQTTVYLDAFSLTWGVRTNHIADANVTAAKLANGAIDAKTKFGSAMAAIQKGASNPAGPATDDHNWRTDIDRGAYYDGTRWVTPDVKILPFDAPRGNTATTTNNDNVGRLCHNGDLDWLLYRFAASVFVSGTNNASNFWTLTCRYITAGNTVTNIASMSTAAIAANTWNRIATATFSPVTAPATAFMLEVIASTTGAPGSLLVVPQLMIREIIP